jgi:hypothetical protein
VMSSLAFPMDRMESIPLLSCPLGCGQGHAGKSICEDRNLTIALSEMNSSLNEA